MSWSSVPKHLQGLPGATGELQHPGSGTAPTTATAPASTDARSPASTAVLNASDMAFAPPPPADGPSPALGAAAQLGGLAPFDALMAHPLPGVGPGFAGAPAAAGPGAAARAGGGGDDDMGEGAEADDQDALQLLHAMLVNEGDDGTAELSTRLTQGLALRPSVDMSAGSDLAALLASHGAGAAAAPPLHPAQASGTHSAAGEGGGGVGAAAALAPQGSQDGSSGNVAAGYVRAGQLAVEAAAAAAALPEGAKGEGSSTLPTLAPLRGAAAQGDAPASQRVSASGATPSLLLPDEARGSFQLGQSLQALLPSPTQAQAELAQMRLAGSGMLSSQGSDWVHRALAGVGSMQRESPLLPPPQEE